MGKMLFRQGEVVTLGGLKRLDILVEDGKIAALLEPSCKLPLDCEVIPCQGKLILPGLIDAHCHIALDTGVFATQDGWALGSQEAALGGITTVIDFVGPRPGQSLIEAFDLRLAEAEPSRIDYSFHMTALDASASTLADIARLRALGLKSLKLYTTYRPNYYVDDATLLAVLEAAKAEDLVTLIHCESDAIVSLAARRHAGAALWESYPRLRPALAELEAVGRVLRLAEFTGAVVVIAHNSCAESAKMVAAARKRGVRAYCETGPQYFCLSEDRNFQSKEPWRFLLQPPLRSRAEMEALGAAVLEGDIDMLITDHCAYTRAQKLADPHRSPGGLPGFETLLGLSAALEGMTWPTLARLLSENPAKIYGLWPQKGAILPGFDADLVVLEDRYYQIDERKLKGFAGYSPYDALRARGAIKAVYRRGSALVLDGQVVEEGCGEGLFLRV